MHDKFINGKELTRRYAVIKTPRIHGMNALPSRLRGRVTFTIHTTDGSDMYAVYDTLWKRNPKDGLMGGEGSDVFFDQADRLCDEVTQRIARLKPEAWNACLDDHHPTAEIDELKCDGQTFVAIAELWPDVKRNQNCQ